MEYVNKNQAVKDYVKDIGEYRWSRVHASRGRWTLMTTNLCESWNAVIRKIKGLPVCDLIDKIRRYLMKEWSKRRDLSNKWDQTYPPNITKLLKERWLVSHKCQSAKSRDDKYEVWETNSRVVVVVDLEKGTCDCRVAFYQNLPCPHMLAVCEKFSKNSDEYCASYYDTSCWRSMYADSIYPVIAGEDWEIPDHVAQRVVKHPGAPGAKKDVGRPQVGRYLNAFEKPHKSGKRACSKCRLPGHRAGSVKCRKSQLESA